MVRKEDKRGSIYIQLLILLLGAAFFAVIVFAGTSKLGTTIVERHFENSAYQKEQNEKYIQKFQTYITDHEVPITDTDSMYQWIKRQKVISLRIYSEDVLIFDSDYPDDDVAGDSIAVGNYSWEEYYTIDFADESGTVVITGFYGYRMYVVATILEIALSVAVFLLVVLLGIRKKIRYIRKLRDEIEILEGGSLDYPITVDGNDELSMLAEGLDQMRQSFQHSLSQEEEIMRRHQKVVTEMAHDIRTPVTSLMLYTEILENGKCEEGQISTYVHKIDEKAKRLKQLTDHLFEYSFLSGNDEVELEEAADIELLFYDLFSEMVNYLEQNGYTVLFDVNWGEVRIRISTEFVMRIIDNITSNILKYADPSQPIRICSVYEENNVCFRFENAIRRQQERVESTHVGLHNVRNMMEKMGGKCVILQEKNHYSISLIFGTNR